jgi:hypothetical protein
MAIFATVSPPGDVISLLVFDFRKLGVDDFFLATLARSA